LTTKKQPKDLQIYKRELLKIFSLTGHFLDADCGRGFTRMENFCVNVSVQTESPADIPARCQFNFFPNHFDIKSLKGVTNSKPFFVGQNFVNINEKNIDTYLGSFYRGGHSNNI
jgi:hypothetical protein